MRTALIASVFLWVSGSLVARAQAAQSAPTEAPSEENDRVARQHFQSGRAYYERAQYQDAAREFAEAYRLSGRPPLLLNLSRAYEGANDYAQAVSALEQWLALEEPDAANRAVEEQRLVRLRAAALRAEQQTQAQPPSTERSDIAPAPEGLSDLEVASIATGASAGGFAIVAIGTGVAAHGTYETLKSVCPDNACPPERQADVNTGAALATTSTVFTGLAVAGGVVSIVLLIVDLTSEPSQSASHGGLRLRQGPGDLGLELAGNF